MNYWLSPTGRAYSGADLGCHVEMALEILHDKFPSEFDECGCCNHDPVDRLESKGYIRYIGWKTPPEWIIYLKRPTNKQIRRMFDLTGFIYK